MYQSTQKISISLPENLYSFIENYQKTSGCSSRSEVINRALELLRQEQLKSCYKEANKEIDTGNDFEITLSDGLDDEAW